MDKTKIDIKHVLGLAEERYRINKLDINDIQWMENGKELDVKPEMLEAFEFTGLNNTDFITGSFYNGTITKEMITSDDNEKGVDHED